MAKKGGGSWMEAMQATGLQVKSARDALAIRGYLDSGNYALNWAVSGRLLGGYPLGHCGEMFGDPGTGKSFLAARAIAMAQAAGGVALLDDAEGAYNTEHSERLGIDVDALPVTRSNTVKKHLAATQAFIKAVKAHPQPPAIEVLDSLASLSTDHELETQLDKRDMTKAAELKAFYRIVRPDILDLSFVHLATNHTIAAIGSMFQKKTTGGGGGPKFTASWRLDMRATSKIRTNNEITGVICRAVVDKNRFAAPWREVKLAIPFNQPISKASGLIPLLTALGIVEERGSFLFYQETRLGRTYKSKDKFLAQDESAEAMLDQFPEILEEADKIILEGRARPVSSGAAQEEDAEPEEVVSAE